jgi:tRNA pseudouridine38-40 synthase
MRMAWNNILPLSILIRSLEQDDQFHPHYQVKQKIYYYHLFFDGPLPFVARYGYYVSRLFDPQRFQETLHLFVGTHDFSAFYTGNDRENAVRTIGSIHLEYIPRYKVYRVVVLGERFLRHMVRRMIGAALVVASREGITHADIRDALQTGMMNAQLLTAPAQGLMLRKIIYEKPK